MCRHSVGSVSLKKPDINMQMLHCPRCFTDKEAQAHADLKEALCRDLAVWPPFLQPKVARAAASCPQE